MIKYWYLKGGDALGPLDPAQIVKDADFSMDVLVCPEHQAELESAWKTPGDYIADFGPFLGRRPASGGAAASAPAQYVRAIEDISPEETIHTRSPLNAALENNLLEDLPAAAPLASAAQPAPATAPKQSAPKPAPVSVPAPVEPPGPPPETFTNSAAVLFKSGGVDIASETEEYIPAPHKPGPVQESSPMQAGPINVFERQTLTPDHSADADKVPTDVQPAGHMILPTTNGKIINSMDPYRQEPAPKKNDTMYILFGVMFIVVAVALFMAFFYNESPKPHPQPPTAESTQHVQPAMQGLDEGIASPSVKPEQDTIRTPALSLDSGNVVAANNDTAAKNISMSIVKQYLLGSRGTIEEYFNKTYADYTTAWSAEHLYQDIYVVYFHAAKVRQEPVRYMFRVDIKNRDVKGMNNISMDLLNL